MERLPRGAKLKLTWLATAFVVVWVSAPGAADQGVYGAGPAVAAGVATVSAADAAAPGGVLSTRDQGGWLEVRLARDRVAEEGGVRLGVLAVVDEPAPDVEGAEAGARLVSVYVALKNVGTSRVAYTALDLELRDRGSRYVSLGARGGPGPMLTFGTLAPGEAGAGWRMFRVPADAGSLRLAFALNPNP